MFLSILYVLFLIFLFVFTTFIFAYLTFAVYSSLMGSPYIATKKARTAKILNKLKPKKGDVFIDLGCGDGRVVEHAVTNYGVKGIGIDINPILIMAARIRFGRMKNIKFKRQNILDADIKKADYIYLFLLPELIDKLKHKLAREAKKGALVITHGFKIKGWDKLLTRTIKDSPFPTYFYKIR